VNAGEKRFEGGYAFGENHRQPEHESFRQFLQSDFGLVEYKGILYKRWVPSLGGNDGMASIVILHVNI